jgi:hypothetical protein
MPNMDLFLTYRSFEISIFFVVCVAQLVGAKDTIVGTG